MKIINRKGFTLVEIMIVVAIIALLAAIAIPNLLRAKLSANDAVAIAKLRGISKASEAFTMSANGNYPTTITSLTGPTPPYFSEDPCGKTLEGYVYTCAQDVSSYTITATPVTIGASGTTTYAVTTGGVLTP